MSYKAKIVTAIEEFKDRTGSSAIAIKKHIIAANPDMSWKNSVFLTTLKKSVAGGDFIQIKNSYKLSPEYKKKLTDALKPKKPKKKAAPKVAPKKKAAPKKKSAPKKSASKKASAKVKKTTKKITTKKGSSKKTKKTINAKTTKAKKSTPTKKVKTTKK
mmetsp:Transcript_27889/g.55913  ORF Transcript_27889/g.55913 Transcript_27889/m.55913 type:complete len:159 (+) Transcript_27889:51-527(+)|eukprot:CAMPEP_0194337404 /NCGR_PEP_ID=MMETSP0171-20130528/76186_1 /TAXON_ID=218684 /ORGANISM="Corethron pennatum, Strain L29A3" /LENGTH=158 /DNA_ID=CAMNT_0039101171 /DNA_START=55 /DNA_END=531 /DNA_ORIENTATION=+